jgi:hypothetical protein
MLTIYSVMMIMPATFMLITTSNEI